MQNTIKLRTASVVRATLLTLCVFASQSIAGVSGLAVQLYDVSGLRQQIAMIPAQTERSFDIIALSESMPLEFERLDQQAIRAAVPRSFSESRLQSIMLTSLSDVAEEDLQRMIRWFNSELGRKVRDAELANSLLSNQDRFAEYKQALNDAPVNPKRRMLAERLDKSLRVSESAADTLINVQIGFTLSIMSAAGSPFQVEDYVDSVRSSRPQIVDSYRSDSVETILFIYQDLSDNELARFSDSMYQQSARQFIRASNDGIANGMLAASSQLGTAIGEMFDDTPVNSGI
jgi:hypothetical protein